MNRRSFLRRLAGVFTTPLAAIPIVESKFAGLIPGNDYDYVTLYRTNGNGEFVVDPQTVTIGQWSDYISMQWDVGNGYLDIPGSKKMGRLHQV